jgi:uncharacterized protein
MTKSFLTAEWRKLAMANYAVDKSILQKYVPKNTMIDEWKDTCYLSLVGFMFLNTRLGGFKIPFHSNFEEVNLRFYVRYKDHDEWKRGVVFIREIVPRPALSLVARIMYGEPYVTMPMDHLWDTTPDSLLVQYRWKKKAWNSLQVNAAFDPQEIKSDSEEEFITEHFWGYTKLSESRTMEYGVEHPRWKVYPVRDSEINVDYGDVYGKEFEFLAKEEPVSVFLAEGSEILVRSGGPI